MASSAEESSNLYLHRFLERFEEKEEQLPDGERYDADQVNLIYKDRKQEEELAIARIRIEGLENVVSEMQVIIDDLNEQNHQLKQ